MSIIMCNAVVNKCVSWCVGWTLVLRCDIKVKPQLHITTINQDQQGACFRVLAYCLDKLSCFFFTLLLWPIMV